ncbi:biopolymer transport protein ExbB [Dysgonomonas sp. PH5-45]|uniref:MotA/TolQ/ExbB proton channel family protein n=1 Tax=unclassified Dysgonomonas TaxID=2630389 RepID=UPI002473BBA5|nr:MULTISPECIES: MotA/TolQ/ExbB proton channel family protein [unclassified Dysgonomonas]MDH6354002.1 biopolymer transport protein ExbB [Dysgonomonas sp. PH5-45]MDH6386904.1 biopolymer transport protein ExbB [Dysgonomonas sp. PH5-37]
METKKQQTSQKPRSKGVSAFLVVILCGIVAHMFFYGVAGAGSDNFLDVFGLSTNFDDKGHPLAGNMLGTLYQGGWVIPIVITLLLTVLTLSVERFFAMNRASGKGNVGKFVAAAKAKLEAGDVSGAEKLCDEQKGSVANILKAALVRYKDVETYAGMNNDEKAAIIQKEIEEATTLELPYLEQNLPVIATISTLGTLFGLFGTVLGMIKSFSAMGQEGAPDSTALAVGISEALMNTAMGIGTGALAIISYSYFSGKVQDMTNAVDEVGFAIGQTYTKKH